MPINPFVAGTGNIKITNINGFGFILSASSLSIAVENIEQGVSISTQTDQNITLANGSTYPKNEKVMVQFTLVGSVTTLNTIYSTLLPPESIVSLDITLDNGQGVQILAPVLQMLRQVKTNDNIRIMCTIEKSIDDIDSIVILT